MVKALIYRFENSGATILIRVIPFYDLESDWLVGATATNMIAVGVAARDAYPAAWAESNWPNDICQGRMAHDRGQEPNRSEGQEPLM
jgi:hypothetical protein